MYLADNKENRGKSVQEMTTQKVPRKRIKQHPVGVKVISSTPSQTVDERRWCELCSIRIAPSEQHREIAGKLYHMRCANKLAAKKPTREAEVDPQRESFDVVPMLNPQIN